MADRINGPGKRELAPNMPDYHDANGGLGINKPYQPPGYVSLEHQAGPSLRRRQLARPPATSIEYSRAAAAYREKLALRALMRTRAPAVVVEGPAYAGKVSEGVRVRKVLVHVPW